MEKRNSHLEHGQPRGLFCMCHLGLARFQLQHQCHFWQMSLMFVLHGQVSLAAVNQICVIHEAMKGCKKS